MITRPHTRITTLSLLLLMWLPVATTADSSTDTSDTSDTSEATAHYLANEGVMIVAGGQKVVFDPLFNNDYGQFEMLPKPMRAALMAGDAPYDGLTAVFISHSHEDHFAPDDMAKLMRQHKHLHLFAPADAVQALSAASSFTPQLSQRITAISRSDELQTFTHEGIQIEAFNIPHSGYPNRMTDVHNLAFRVTVGGATVIHLGDSDTRHEHFIPHQHNLDARHTHMAFPPYWFVYSDTGKAVLKERLRPGQVVGIHVPVQMPDNESDRPAEYRGPDLFTRPGETRKIEKKSMEPLSVQR